MTRPASKGVSSACLLFALIFLFELLWAFQGLDVTDSGFHLTNQVAALGGRVGEVSPLYYLTDFVGGLWLSIPGEPNLLWARLGGVLLYSTSAAFSYSILARHFAPRKVFVAVLCSSLFLTARMFLPLIHYFTLPAALLVAGVGLFDRLLASAPGSPIFRLCAVLLGAMPVPVVLCRLSPLPIVLPLAVVLYFALMREPMTALRQAAPYLALGLLGSVLGGAIFYASTGALDHYVAFLGDVFSRDTSNVAMKAPARLIGSFFVGYGWVAGCTAAGCLALLAVAPLREPIALRLGRLPLRIAAVGALAMAGIAVLLVLRGSAPLAITHARLTILATGLFQLFQLFLYFLIGFTLLVSLLFLMHDRGQSLRLSLLLVTSNTMMVVSPIGSSAGIMKSVYGMWVALPLMLLVADRLRRKLGGAKLRAFLAATGTLAGLLAILGIGVHCLMVYRDDWRPMLTQEFHHGHLRHIYSQPARVRAVDEALAQIDLRTEKGDLALMLGPLHLFYYLTETQPALGSLWLGAWTPEEISRKYREAVAHGRYPKVLVISEVSTRNRYWPSRSLPADRAPAEREKLELLREKFVDELRYELVWENDVFSMYSPPSGNRPGAGSEANALPPSP